MVKNGHRLVFLASKKRENELNIVYRYKDGCFIYRNLSHNPSPSYAELRIGYFFIKHVKTCVVRHHHRGDVELNCCCYCHNYFAVVRCWDLFT